MATNRFQFSDDFVLKNGKVGINTAEPQEKLEVLGTIIADNIRATDISNLHTYEGFINQNHNIDENLTLSSDTTTSLSGEIIVGDDATVTIGSEATSSQGNIDSLKVYNTFTVPTGGTEDRPRKVKPGQLYYNVDFKTIEFWDGNVWRQVDNTTRSGRGVFITGQPPGFSDVIDYVNIATLGNAVNFGTSTVANRFSAGCSDGIRGVFSLGYKNSGFANELEYITIASEGNSIDFGDSKLAYGEASVSSSTRGIWGGGQSPSPIGISNVIDYIQIQTLGNTLDFGDLTQPKDTAAGCSSPTRGVFGGGKNPSIRLSEIDFITISSTGNAIDFGDLTQARRTLGAFSNSTRGVFGGGYTDSPAALFKTIDFITIASTGNAQTFGELPYNGGYLTGTSSQTRGVFGGASTPSQINNISYVTINSTGNAQDFGDLTVPRSAAGALSDSHGGLGGF